MAFNFKKVTGLSLSEDAKFGTIKGVYIPSLLTIFGVVMYLRMGWVVGHSGLFGTLIIVTLSTAITFLTGLSISATATNMRVKGGGAYYMISRSFGVEAGAAIGIPLFLAQAIGISFYIAGFSESIQRFLPMAPQAVIGTIILGLLTYLTYVSADLALRAQYFIFALIVISLISIFWGSPLGEEFVVPERVPESLGFWPVFAVFFPAVTGILTGVSMSGDLKDPGRSLPVGTISAVLTGYVVYMILPVFLYYMASSDVLKTNLMIVQDIAALGVFVVLGLWGASLSSALGGLLGAPRTMQALARDRVIPRFFGKGSGATDAPRVATIVSFVIALAGIWLGDLNVLAPILTMFFLTAYGFLNFAAGMEGLIGNPSWRPKFKTPWYLSMLGAFGCFAVMMMIDSGATFIALFFCVSVFLIVKRRNLGERWTDIRYSMLLLLARYSVYKLSEVKVNPRSWRPNILVLSGSPTTRWSLIQLAHTLTHGKGFLSIASIVSKKKISLERVENMKVTVRDFLIKRGVNSLVEIKQADDVMIGAESLVNYYGLGHLSPNTFLLGDSDDPEKIKKIVDLVQLLFFHKKNVVLVRGAKKIDSESHEKKKHYRMKIDVWWGGQQNNAGLMLALSYMLSISPDWAGAKLQLKTIVKTEKEKENAQRLLVEFIDQGRLGISLDVIVKLEHQSYLDCIYQESLETDLVFLGIKPPQHEESVEEYQNYFQSLIVETKKFPPTMMVMAAESLNFKEIFH